LGTEARALARAYYNLIMRKLLVLITTAIMAVFLATALTPVVDETPVSALTNKQLQAERVGLLKKQMVQPLTDAEIDRVQELRKEQIDRATFRYPDYSRWKL